MPHLKCHQRDYEEKFLNRVVQQHFELGEYNEMLTRSH